MPPVTPKPKVKRPAWTDPAWLTEVAVNLLDGKLASLAQTAAKALKVERQDLERSLRHVYRDALRECLEAAEVACRAPSLRSFDIKRFDPDFPMSHPAFSALLEQVQTQVLRQQDAEAASSVIEHVRTNFGKYFKMVVFDRDDPKYREAKRFSERLWRGDDTPEGQLIAHTNEILRAIDKKPLPIDATLTLRHTYVIPQARYWDDTIQEKGRDADAQDVTNLIASLIKTLGNSTAPIILHGQPGHGKSSTVQMLTLAIMAYEREQRRQQPTHVLLYEFKRLGQLDDNEIRVLAGCTPFLKDEHFFHGKRIVLILDGMDERQITEGTDRALTTFISRLFGLAARVNAQPPSRLHLVLTGRSQFVHQIRHAFTSDYHLFEIQDFAAEQVEIWLDKYGAQKQITPPLTREDFEAKHLGELIAQPILLTICAMMLADSQGQQLLGALQPQQVSRGAIYQTIVQWTYRKKWQSHPLMTIPEMTQEAEYERLLRTIAFIMFRQGQESIEVSELIKALKRDSERYSVTYLAHKEAHTIEEILESIAVSFYFTGLEKRVFTFIHKTIKDYLTVEAWFDLLLEATRHFDATRPETSCAYMAEWLYFVFGAASISPVDHIAFLRDVINMRKSDALPLFEPLSTFFQIAETHAYLLKHGGEQDSDPLMTEANLLSALVHIPTNIFHVCSKEEPEAFSPDGLLHLFESPDSLYKLIHVLNANEESRFYNQSFDLSRADLRRTNLREANLRRANLRGADLREANLRGADLGRANLSEADLTGADLNEAKLRNADLYKADLNEAKLRNANLSGADLNEAKLCGADLTEADLNEAHLNEADLRRADLRRADLSGALLSEANLTDANLRRADLTEADLSGARLSQAQLDQAYVDETTLLPDGLSLPQESPKRVQRKVTSDPHV